MIGRGAHDKPTVPLWMPRFLAPAYSAAGAEAIEWQARGYADTPAADAQCRILLSLNGAAGRGGLIARAGFEVLGPAIVVGCADWVCEWLSQTTIEQARALSVSDVEQALDVAPSQRYAALLVTDALTQALAHALAAASAVQDH